MGVLRSLQALIVLGAAASLAGCSSGGDGGGGGAPSSGQPPSPSVKAEVTQLISIGLAGIANNQSGHQPTHTVLPGAGTFTPFGRQVAMSQDSGFVAFTSSASDLILGDTNGVDDIYLRNRNGSVTTRVSLGAGGVQANKASFSPVVSADGRYVAFSSLAGNLDPLLPADLSTSPVNIFRRDRVTGVTELVNVCLGIGCFGGTKGLAPLGANQLEIKVPSMSDDGRFIAWTIGANGATPNGSLFIRDMSLTTPPVSSVPSFEYQFIARTISGSGPTALVGEDSSSNQFPGQGTIVATLSGDGKVLAFITDRAHIRRETPPPPAPPVPTGDLNCDFDVYVGDVNLTEIPDPTLPNLIVLAPPQVLNVTRVTAMPDVCQTGQSTTRLVRRLALSRDGRFIAYGTSNDELNGGDTNQKFDVYVYDRASGTKELVSVANGTPASGGFGPGVLGGGDSFGLSISDDGNIVAFLSDAPNLVTADANGTTTDVFVRNRATRQTLLVSKSQSGLQPNPGTTTLYPVISGDGRGIAFSSNAGNLTGTVDTNGFADVFLACSGAGASCP